MFFSSPYRGAYNATREALSDVADAKAIAHEAKSETELMRADIDRLLLISEALWNFLKQRHGYSDEDLAKAVGEIDLRDGNLDGKVARSASQPCPQCGKPNTATRKFCIYCGTLLPIVPFAR